MSKSASPAGGSLTLSVAVLAAAVLTQLAGDKGYLAPLLNRVTGGVVAKQYGSFEAFYPFYLKEHSTIECKRFHYAGTAAMLVFLLFQSKLILPILTAAAVGYTAFPFFRHLQSGLPEMALMIGTYIVCGVASTKSFKKTLLPLLLGYGCAWVGHYAFEGNKPATFVYPIFSLMGDFNMLLDALRGKQPL
jgi:hypothetical protein